MGNQFLFAEASPFEGAGRLFDFAGTLTEFNNSLTPEQAEYFAMLADWRAAGDDIRSAMRLYEEGRPVGKR